MKESDQFSLNMMDILDLSLAIDKYQELIVDQNLCNYSFPQLIRELLTPQYYDKGNRRYETNLRLSKLINKGASIEKIKSDNDRLYNDATVQQILSFRFAAYRKNIGVYGVTAAGKSYFLSACCNEGCRLNYRCKLFDYCELLDEFIALNNKPDLSQYQKRIKYYARIQLLFIYDFAISGL